MRNIVCIFALLIFSACQSRVVPVSQRGIDGFNKPGSPYMHGRNQTKPQSRPELYVEKREIEILENNPQNETGSLFNLDHQANYLYLASLPRRIGQSIDVKIVPTKQTEAESKKQEEAKKEGEKEGAADSGDAFVKEMLTQLPELQPADGESGKLVDKVRMRIVRIYDNGDYSVLYQRSSKQGSDAREITARARVPYEAVSTGDGVTTRDLTDVQFLDSLDGTYTERNSAVWEDEYSLRMSGFTEAKSVYARQLEEKRKQIESVRGKLNNQLVSLGKERRKMAEERDKLAKEKLEAEAKRNELQDLTDKQQKELDEYKKQELELAEAEKKKEEEAAAKSESKPVSNAKAAIKPKTSPKG